MNLKLKLYSLNAIRTFALPIDIGIEFADDMIITTRNISKSYGNLRVLKGIDLTINKGEVVSIVGASGAGKTTLLQIIGTLDSADNGSLTIDNVEVRRL